MYTSINVLFVVLFNFLHLGRSATIPANSYEVREHCLVHPYSNIFSFTQSHWDLIGNTIVTDKYIRLTSNEQSQAGGLWSVIPVNYANWEMHVHFKVHGPSSSLYGDGFAIWYVKDPKAIGPVFGYKDYFSGLGVIMDTYANSDQPAHRVHPYISAIINDGTRHYEQERDGESTLLAGCTWPFRDQRSDTLVAIRYENDRLTVSTDTEGKNNWTECFTSDNVVLPTNYYFGFTAATGELSDNHDIISVRTYQLDSTNSGRLGPNRDGIIPFAPRNDFNEQKTQRATDSVWSTIRTVLRVLVVIIFLCGAAGAAFYYYTTRRSYRRARLY